VLEASVHRSRVKKIGKSKLADSSESLERRLVDDLPLPVIDLDKTMDGATYLVSSMGISNQVHPPPANDDIISNTEEKAKVLYHP
jgi:hypothetical protein